MPRLLSRLSLFTLLLVPPTLAAQASPRFAPSGRGTAAIEVALPEGAEGPARSITLDWGQPHLRGRTLHTGTLVPYGEVWRTGANGPTTLATELDLMIGSTHLPAGRYVVFTLPAQDGWQLILQTDAGQTIADYDSAQDAARLPLRMRTLGSPVESLSMWLEPASEGLAAEWRMAWGTTELSIGLTAM
jgi:hypothetical protein